jgi:hypothetical protein
MANDEHVASLKQGVAAWNKWRDANPDIKPDLRRADLRQANLSGAKLSQAELGGAELTRSNLSRAKLGGAYLRGTCLFEADLTEADLSGADLSRAALVHADLTDADLTRCRIYGLSAWGLTLKDAKQQNLVITPPGEPEITVDNIEVAQARCPASAVGADNWLRRSGRRPPDQTRRYPRSF